jgi:arsenate reductase
MRRVLFACVHNAGRSQMAAAFLNALADPSQARALSAGTEPAARVHPVVVEVMQEVGIELGGVQPRRLTPQLFAGITHLITMGCGEACPVVPPAIERRDWPIGDPKAQDVGRVRAIRDEIRARVLAFLAERD